MDWVIKTRVKKRHTFAKPFIGEVEKKAVFFFFQLMVFDEWGWQIVRDRQKRPSPKQVPTKWKDMIIGLGLADRVQTAISEE